MRLIVLSAIFACALGSTANAAAYERTGEMVPELGNGFDPRNPSDAGDLGQCFTTTDGPVPTSATERLNAHITYSIRDMLQRNSISIFASANGDFGLTDVSVSVDYNRVVQKSGTTENLYYSFGFERKYEPQTIATGPTPTDIITPLIKIINNPTSTPAQKEEAKRQFWNTCNPEIVAAVTKDVKLSFVYIFQYKDKAHREVIEAAIEAAYETRNADAESRVKINEFLDSREVDFELEIDVVGNLVTAPPGDSLETIKNETRNNILAEINEVGRGDLGAIFKIIQKYIDNANYSNARIVSFNTARTHKFAQIADVEDKRLVQSIYARKNRFLRYSQQIADRHFALEEATLGIGDGYEYKSAETEEALRQELTSLTTILEDLIDRAGECLQAETRNEIKDKCKFEQTVLQTGLTQYVRMTFYRLYGWRAKIKSRYNPRNQRKIEAVVQLQPGLIPVVPDQVSLAEIHYGNSFWSVSSTIQPDDTPDLTETRSIIEKNTTFGLYHPGIRMVCDVSHVCGSDYDQTCEGEAMILENRLKDAFAKIGSGACSAYSLTVDFDAIGGDESDNLKIEVPSPNLTNTNIFRPVSTP